MHSMTGFGRAELESGGVRIEAQVRALNQRFFELKLNLPRGWGEWEAEMRKLVQAVVARGRVEVFIRRTALRPPPTRLIVNHELAAQYVKELQRLGRKLGLGGQPGVEAILQRPEIFRIVEDEGEERSEAALGMRALGRALKVLQADRKREGISLRRDFETRIGHLERFRSEIARLAEQSRATIIANFQAKVRELLANSPVDERRLYEEASNAAQRADISEELTRLETHIPALRQLLIRKDPVGKPIEFLLQELNREVNTIGAKSQNAALSHIAVEAKGEIEKMREQVQNIE